jgi:hypothetical protein
MVSCWVGSTIPQVGLGQHMCTTLHAAVVSHHQVGLIVTIKMAGAGQNVTVTIRPLQNHPGQKIWSQMIAEVVSHGCSMTGGESLQCQMVRVGVSQCPSGGWPNHHDTLCIQC